MVFIFFLPPEYWDHGCAILTGCSLVNIHRTSCARQVLYQLSLIPSLVPVPAPFPKLSLSHQCLTSFGGGMEMYVSLWLTGRDGDSGGHTALPHRPRTCPLECGLWGRRRMERALGANCVRLQKLPQCWTQEAGWRVALSWT